ncbi:MAG: radical SAM protein [Bacteroidota bacterium]
MTSSRPFYPVYRTPAGEVGVSRNLRAVGVNGRDLWELDDTHLIPLPDGADLLSLPGRPPLALDPVDGEAVVIEAEDGGPLEALAASLPVGFTRLFLPAAEDDGRGPLLPLFGYTAVAERGGRLYAAALRTDDPRPWAPRRYDPRTVETLIAAREKEFPGNRVLAQLARCARDYHCRTAQNLFYRRGEAGLPAAMTCNASCLGCISLQPAACCPSPQSRLSFRPEPWELVDLAVAHLSAGPGRMVSFGQGCEGEPLTVAPLLAETIRAIRCRTQEGTICLNTNGGLPEALSTLLDAGLDRVRVSLFSAVPGDYAAYHRPAGYGLTEVENSLRLVGRRASLNLLVFPGFTDAPRQAEALIGLCRRTGLGQLQLRNLNIDPRLMTPFLRDADPPGLLSFLADFRRALPGVAIGNYTRAAVRQPQR